MLLSGYHSIAHARQNSEHVHRHSRDRGRVNGKDLSSRPRRVPVVDVQRFRNAVQGGLDWFRICLRFGWLDGHRQIRKIEVALRDGSKRLKKTLQARLKRGLDIPYGPVAEALGLVRSGGGPPRTVEVYDPPGDDGPPPF